MDISGGPAGHRAAHFGEAGGTACRPRVFSPGTGCAKHHQQEKSALQVNSAIMRLDGRGPQPPSAQGDLARFLDDTFSRHNWGHTGLLAAIRGLTVEEARWKAYEGAHSVWEQINHIAHWKRYALRRAQGKRPKSHQAWPPAGRTAGELKRSLADLARLHQETLRTVRRLTARDLVEKKGGRYPVSQLLLGEAAHEAYHIGQILLTRKLRRQLRRAGAGRPRS